MVVAGVCQPPRPHHAEQRPPRLFGGDIRVRLCVALVVAAIGGVRGLELTGPALNVIVFLANSVAALASLVSVGVMLFGTLVALRQDRTR